MKEIGKGQMGTAQTPPALGIGAFKGKSVAHAKASVPKQEGIGKRSPVTKND